MARHEGIMWNRLHHEMTQPMAAEGATTVATATRTNTQHGHKAKTNKNNRTKEH